MRGSVATMSGRWVEDFESNTKGLKALSTGLCPGCKECVQAHGFDPEEPGQMDAFEAEWSSGKAYSEPSFSWAACELCNSPLGGDREPYHWIGEDGQIVHGDGACIDCVAYLANGEVPEPAEGES